MADPAARLPEPARSKYRMLRQAADDARAISRAAYEATELARSERHRAQINLNAYLKNAVGRDASEEARLAAAIEEAEAELQRQVVSHTSRGKSASTVIGLASRIERYLGEIPTASIVLFAGNLPKRKEPPADIVSGARAEIERLKAEAYRIVAAPRPSDEVVAAALAELDQLALAGEPDVDNLMVDVGGHIGWASRALDIVGSSVSAGPVVVTGYGIDTAATLAWLFRDQLATRITTIIRDSADDTAAVASPRRPKILAQIAADQLTAERIEEAAIEAAAAQGITILRRADADVRAVLNLADTMPAQRD